MDTWELDGQLVHPHVPSVPLTSISSRSMLDAELQPLGLVVATKLVHFVSDRHLPSRARRCDLGICRREEPSRRACLLPTVCMLDTRRYFHTSRKISFRDVSLPINSRNSGHHDHRRDTWICLHHNHNKSRPASAVLASAGHGTSDTHVALNTRSHLSLLQHSRDTRSSLHTIWREEHCGTRPHVMAHVDSTQHPLSLHLALRCFRRLVRKLQ